MCARKREREEEGGNVKVEKRCGGQVCRREGICSERRSSVDKPSSRVVFLVKGLSAPLPGWLLGEEVSVCVCACVRRRVREDRRTRGGN